MENQHRKIAGYRELNADEIFAMNKIKEKGDEIGEMVYEVECLSDVDKRWVSIACTHLQQGIMALRRAIAKPDSF